MELNRVWFCDGNYVGTRWVACKAHFSVHDWGVMDQKCHAGRASARTDCGDGLTEVSQFTGWVGGAHPRKTICHKLCGRWLKGAPKEGAACVSGVPYSFPGGLCREWVKVEVAVGSENEAACLTHARSLVVGGVCGCVDHQTVEKVS